MIFFIFIIFSITNFINSDQTLKKFEVQFRDGEIIQYDDIGKSTGIQGRLNHVFQVQQKESYFWLQFDYISEVTFKSIKEKTIVADVLLSSGKVKEFEIVKNRYYCKKGDDVLEIPLTSIKKIKLVKQ